MGLRPDAGRFAGAGLQPGPPVRPDAERLAAAAGRLRLRQDPPGGRDRQFRRRHGRADPVHHRARPAGYAAFRLQDPEATFEERFEEIRKRPLLVLDDFGTQNATPWAQEKLFQIFNYRYINHLPLVVTTNLALDEIEGRIRSRLEDPELVTTGAHPAPDYRRPMGDIGHSPTLVARQLCTRQTFASFDLRRGEDLDRRAD